MSTQPIRTDSEHKRGLRGLTSMLLERAAFAARAGFTFDNKRDTWKALGYKLAPTIDDYRVRYRRGGIAEALVEVFPRATWGAGVSIIEDADPGTATPFEEATNALFKRLGVWTRLQRADILAGLGRYSVLLIGAPGELSSPLPSGLSPDSILYLSPLPEDRADIASYEKDPKSPRFGLPANYSINLGAENERRLTTAHWSRIVHVADGLLEDDVFGRPRLQAVWNYLDDLDKIVGGGAEAAWKRMDPGFHLNLDPEVEFDTDSEAALEDEVDDYQHGLRRFMRTRGVEVTPLSTAVVGFGPNADTILKLIASTARIPFRILVGSERGELASGQDRNNFADRVTERRNEYATPLVNTLLDRFIEAGALPTPSIYAVKWPAIDELDELEKADVALRISQANLYQHRSEGTIIETANEVRSHVFGLGAVTSTPRAPDDDTSGPAVGGPIGGDGARMDNNPGDSDVEINP